MPFRLALHVTMEIGFTLFKNISFALFTFLPVIVLALVTYVLGWFWSCSQGRKYYISRVTSPCMRAIVWQFAFLSITGGLFGLFYVIGKVEGIPVVLLLPLSTIVSFFVFFKRLFGERRDNHTLLED